MKRIETRENEFVNQLQKVLYEFSHINLKIGFDLDYYIGEDDNNIRGLCFELTSKTVGLIYFKFQQIESHETPYDYEEGFINDIVHDLVLAGISFMHLTEVEKLSSKTKEGEWLKASRKLYAN